MRLDLYLFEKGFAKSRSYAKMLISEGFVKLNGKAATKSSTDVSDGDLVEVTGKPFEYVSRGGLKLEAAINAFDINVNGFRCVDIGASTGGFTDCLLKKGASYVVAVDIGHDQLDSSLVNDPRVLNLEGVNARDIDETVIGGICDIAVSDISFISQTYVIPNINGILSENGIYVALIKPQFECGRSGLGKNGIVKDKKTRYNAVKRVIDCSAENGLNVVGLIKSPIEGGDGNTEYLMYCTKNGVHVSDNIVKEVCGL